MLAGKNIYWIGGSPCSGKSTISEILVDEFNFDMYKCDDHLGRYTQIGADNGAAIMKKLLSLDTDGIWLRSVDEQVADAFKFYGEALKIIVSDLEKMNDTKGILVEGAAILPEFIQQHNIDPSRYVCIVPTERFQLKKYRQRTWVDDVLKDCSDKEKAFENWMNRDIAFAKIVRHQAEGYGHDVMITDGCASVEATYARAKSALGL